MTRSLQFVLGLLVLGFLSSCGATSNLEVTALEPAAINLEQGMSRIGIINSSNPEAAEISKDKLEAYFTKEDSRLAESGVHAALEGLKETLEADARFDEVVLIPDTPDVLIGLGTEPEQVAWQSIANLCKKHELEAIFALANYETDTEVKLKKTSYLALDLIRVENKVRGHELTVETLIENGWRIYEPKSQKILDEFSSREEIISIGQGVTPVRALEDLGSRHEDIVYQGKMSGTHYGSRLKPMERKIPRIYYIKGSPVLEEAHEHALNEDWDRVKPLWEKEVNNPKVRVRQRACHNLAVWYEYNGRLKEAIIWATKSHELGKNKTTKIYLDSLLQRESKEEIVQDQLAQTQYSD
ncbi:MAG: hypothetical protein KJO04_04125 [Bacteroidia bacterium]|nr:hypothetical protein [Bacteroidia bacterium]